MSTGGNHTLCFPPTLQDRYLILSCIPLSKGRGGTGWCHQDPKQGKTHQKLGMFESGEVDTGSK